MLDKYITIGYTKKTYGSKGQVKMIVEDHYLDDLINSDFVFINYMGKPLPFFIEAIDEGGDYLLKLEDIDSPEEAKAIVSKDLLLREKDVAEKIKKEKESHLFFDQLIDFLIIDEVTGEIGIIKEIRELPQQELAVVDYQEREILIPLHPSLIKDILEKEKKVILNLPDGILDL